MALGNQNYNNNKEKKDLFLTVYSGYSFYNSESQVDPSSLSFTFGMNKLVKISISPAITKTDGPTRYDHENAGSISLTAIKAKMFAKEIRMFLAGELKSIIGVKTTTGGIITIDNCVEYGVNSPCLIIRKVNEENEVLFTYIYEFKQTNVSFRGEQGSSLNDLTEYCHKTLELEMFCDLLEDYSRSMSGAAAFGFMEFNKYNAEGQKNLIKAIGEKVGIENKYGNNNNKGGQQGRGPSGSGNNSTGLTAAPKESNYNLNSIDDIDELM